MYYALRDSEINREIRAPSKLKHRFIVEDVEFGLVPFSSLGMAYGVETPTMNSLIYLASLINETDYMKEGATLERLGIVGLTLRELHAFLKKGEP